MPPANSPSDIPSFLLPPTSTSATGRNSTTNPIGILHHSLPSHPDGILNPDITLNSTLQRLLSQSEGNQETRSGLGTGSGQTTTGGAGGNGGGGQARASTGGVGAQQQPARTVEPNIFERPQLGTSNPSSMMSRTLPPPPRSSTRDQSLRQTLRDLTSASPLLERQRPPYSSRPPPQYGPGHRQSLYDWAPEPYAQAMFDSEEMLFSRLPMSDTMIALSGPQFLARLNRNLRDEANSSASSASATPINSQYPGSSLQDVNDSRSHPSTHITNPDSLPLRTAMWNTIHHYSRRRQQDREMRLAGTSSFREDSGVGGSTSWMENISRRDTEQLRHRNRLRRRERRNAAAMDLDDPDMKDLSDIIIYLAKLRSSRSYSESARLIEKHIPHHTPKEVSKPDPDFMIDTRSLRVPECSYLQPGAIFHGSQTTEPQRIANLGTTSTTRPSSTTPTITTSTSNTPGVPNVHDWKVKVRITSVDYSTMRLTGTMEAFGDWLSSTGEKRSISTYLEGEIIDFKTHTLETFNFPCESLVDACYWSKLEPFSGMKDSEDGKKRLLSKKWIKQELLEKYILMRWKEKCFIDTDKEGKEEQILTIRGFYFLTLRRRDGAVMGLYYDPESPPLQELLLEPKRGVTFPKFEMR